MRGGVKSRIYRNPFYILMQWHRIGESPGLIIKCVFAQAQAALQRLHESLCLSTPLSSLLPVFFRSLWGSNASFIKMPLPRCPKSFAQKGKAQLISIRLCLKGSRCLSRSLSLVFTWYVWIYMTGTWREIEVTSWKGLYPAGWRLAFLR